MNRMGINANDIKILGNYAYVSVRYQGFDIFDVSNPRNISLAGKATDAAYYNEGIFPIKNYTFVSLESLGIGIYDTSLITKPKTLTRIQLVGGVDSVIIRGSTMYIGAHNEGIWTVDISNPAKPKEISFISNLGRNVDMDLVGNNLYVAGAWSSLSIVDVMNAADPRMVYYHFGTSATSVLADGNYVYTDEGIVDLTNIRSPVYLAKSPYFAGGGTAKFGNNYLVVASSDGLHIIDVSNKKSPVLVTTFEPGVSYSDVKIRGNVAVAAVGNSIVTVDLSNVKSPRRLSQISYTGVWYANALVIHDTIAYAAGRGPNDVRAFDISNPAEIKLVDSINLGGDFGTISYDNGYLAVGGKMAAYILSTSVAASPPPVVTPPVGTSSITVTAPDGGETWQRGTTRTITWDYSGNPGSTVKIVLLKAGVEVGTIKDSVSIGSAGKGSYSWPISLSGMTGSDFKVSVQSTGQPAVNDVSNNYLSITSASISSSITPSITVSAPHGGETWQRGTTRTITWDYSGNPGSTVKIVLLKAGVEVGTIKDSVSIGSAGKGSYSWPMSLSGMTGSDFKVSVQSTGQPAVNDVSTNMFAISTPPSVTVSAPHGGEIWKRGTTKTISWDYTGNPGSTVKIVLLKAGVEVGTIKDSVSIGSAGKGSYSWPMSLSGMTGSDFKVSIQSTGQPAVKDVSTNLFTITV